METKRPIILSKNNQVMGRPRKYNDEEALEKCKERNRAHQKKIREGYKLFKQQQEEANKATGKNQ